MECRVASTEDERTAILRQRHDVFVEEFNFFVPKDDTQKIEYDQYDAYALLFGVWEKEILIASCRLILPNNPLGLPTLISMQIDPEKFQSDLKTAEISRITVASTQRAFRKTIKILQTMQKEINRISADYGIIQWVGAVGPTFLRLLNQSRLPYRPIGPLQLHIGAERYPIILILQEYISSLKENR
ncbi:MAG: GNAT family N-acetyltransferase [Sulfuricurvum sp.]|uniref:acyl-homoserine-lactone synthase n=1 Tax=Sulfuricurvum sp. TaxID=2025608 RepID=UPI00262EA325|nr:GNAT family N-acyltransferase [Sulfuricurvum sp.]MDD5161206.1 GNAT family N-acetyltransferase [Sulfuricurvum sp.]